MLSVRGIIHWKILPDSCIITTISNWIVLQQDRIYILHDNATSHVVLLETSKVIKSRMDHYSSSILLSRLELEQTIICTVLFSNYLMEKKIQRRERAKSKSISSTSLMKRLKSEIFFSLQDRWQQVINIIMQQTFLIDNCVLVLERKKKRKFLIKPIFFLFFAELSFCFLN